MYKCTYAEVRAGSSNAVMIDGGRTQQNGMGDDSLVEEGIADEVDGETIDCIAERGDRKREVIYGICGLLNKMASEQGKNVAKDVIKMLYNEYFDVSRYREVMKSFEDCEKMLSRETEKRVEENRFMKQEMSVISGQITMAGDLYNRSAVKVLRQQVMLSSGYNLFLRPHGDKNDKFDRKHPMKGLYIRSVYDTIKQEVMRDDGREMIRNKRDEVEEQGFAGNVQILSNKTATNLKSTALVAYPVHAMLMSFTYSFRQ